MEALGLQGMLGIGSETVKKNSEVSAAKLALPFENGHRAPGWLQRGGLSRRTPARLLEEGPTASVPASRNAWAQSRWQLPERMSESRRASPGQAEDAALPCAPRQGTLAA